MITPGLIAYRLAYQVAPIVLTGGVAQNIPGGMLSVLSVLQSGSFLFAALGLVESALGIDDWYANFHPVPGGTLIENEVGRYPFANQAIAGNAIIAQGLNLSMLMISPVRDIAGYALQSSIIGALKSTLDQHNAAGGTYTVLTPAYAYTNGILLRLSDVSNAESKQAQNAWQWDFYFPLVTQAAADSAQNATMSQLSNGTQISGQPAWSGSTPTVGNPATLATPDVAAPAAATPGTTIAPSVPSPISLTPYSSSTGAS